MSSFKIPDDVLNDLCSRFIINLPDEELASTTRLLFHIENAYWFYLDFYVEDNALMKRVNMRDFTRQVFLHVDVLRHHAAETDSILENWKEYKGAVPTYGAILLDESLEKVVLVQGYWTKLNWGFPKGKVNEEEEPHICACREVLEETGFDISDRINKHDYLEHEWHEQHCKLYIVPNISSSVVFQPQTRKEIRKIQWFNVHDLPCHKNDLASVTQLGLEPNCFFMVMPFVKRLRKWIFNYKQRQVRNPQQYLEASKALDFKTLKKQQEHYLANKLRQDCGELIKAKLQAQLNNIPKSAKGLARTKNAKDAVPNFMAPSWASFSLDKARIMQALHR